MARQNINLGTAPGGLDGDDARTAFTKTNANFTELYGGTVLQPLNAKLSAISASVWAANQLMYTTGAGTVAMTALTAFARSLLDDADAAAARTTLGLGTAATQNVAASQTANSGVLRWGDRGIGRAMALPPGQDLNTLKEPGVYQFTSGTAPVNTPVTSAQYIEVYGSDAYPWQIVRGIYGNPGNAGAQFVRSAKVANPTAAAADWTDWFEIQGTLSSAYATDLNNISANGRWGTTATAANVPIGAGSSTGQGYVDHFQWLSGTYAKQEWTSILTDDKYIRRKVAGTWQPWVRMLKEVDGGLVSNTGLEATDPWLGNRFKGWANNSPTGPSGASLAVGLDMGYNPARRFQIALSTTGDMFTRVNVAAEPTDNAGWRRVHTENTVVGTVRQNPGPGAPSAIIERGSNSNGEYTRFADGTQICTHTAPASVTCSDGAYGVLLRSGYQQFTYPMAFVGAIPQVVASCRYWGSENGVTSLAIGTSQNGGLTAVNLMALGGAATSGGRLGYIAIGRWY